MNKLTKQGWCYNRDTEGDKCRISCKEKDILEFPINSGHGFKILALNCRVIPVGARTSGRSPTCLWVSWLVLKERLTLLSSRCIRQLVQFIWWHLRDSRLQDMLGYISCFIGNCLLFVRFDAALETEIDTGQSSKNGNYPDSTNNEAGDIPRWQLPSRVADGCILLLPSVY